MRGMAEADVMRAKGYSQKDVLDTEVQKAYAEGIGNMGSGTGSGGGGGIGADMINLFAGMKMAENVADRLGSVMGAPTGAVQPSPVQPSAAAWSCPCGENGNIGKFCMSCGSPKPAADEGWTCACGQTGNKGKFCMECGSPKPVADEGWTCACGQTDNKGKFCMGCGEKKPQ